MSSSTPPNKFNSGSGEKDEEKNEKVIGEKDSHKNTYNSTTTSGNNNDTNNKDTNKSVNPHFKRILWHLICSTRGGVSRAKILSFIIDNPSNANQMSIQLKLDYKTIVHHLDVLVKNNLIMTENEETYGATYFISPLLEKNHCVFKEIMDKIGKK